MCSNQPDGLIAITGATGWIGRTAILELQRLLPASMFAERVRLFASRPGTLTLPEAGTGMAPVHALQSLPDLAAYQPLAAVLHAAFLTRDRLPALGQDVYVSTNRWITDQVAQALVRAPDARAVVVSSGAAAPYDHHPHPWQSLPEDPYGVLKHDEETILSGLASTLVLRIYALSGRFIRDPHRFALGDFLGSALRGQAIRLQASMPVWRSYGHAGDITALAWRWLMAGDPPPGTPLAAVSVTVDLLSLAQTITNLFALPPVQANLDPGAPANRYQANPEAFLAALAQAGLTPTSLEQQLLDTAAGLQLP